MSKLINADELEPDTEWSDYYDGFVSYSQSQINDAEEVKAIPIDKVKKAREEIMQNVAPIVRGDNVGMALYRIKKVLDTLIEEGNGEGKEDN